MNLQKFADCLEIDEQKKLLSILIEKQEFRQKKHEERFKRNCETIKQWSKNSASEKIVKLIANYFQDSDNDIAFEDLNNLQGVYSYCLKHIRGMGQVTINEFLSINK
jgi:hypothetical protein